MPKSKKNTSKAKYQSSNFNLSHSSWSDKLQAQFKSRDSVLSLILGVLIVLVVGILVINFFKKGTVGNLGPSQQASNQNDSSQTTQPVDDVKPDSLPGKYTIKEGDTLYKIAQTYYNDGFQYTMLAQANNLPNPDVIETGQVITIPKPDLQTASPAPIPSTSDLGTGGATNVTIWGDKITSDTYTVVDGDWLSKISGRAYGDIYQFDRIAKANNITNPNEIEPGTTLKIPR